MLLLLFAAPAGGYSTNATLDAFTVSATGTVLVQATASNTLDAFTSSSTATVLVQAALSATLGAFTANPATYSPARLAELSATLGAFTASSAKIRMTLRGRIGSVFVRGGNRTNTS